MIEAVRRFASRVEAAHDLDAVQRLVQHRIVELGFDRFAYIQLKVPELQGRIYLGSYPADWASFYRDRSLHIHDPVWGQNYRTIRPYLWEDALSVTGDARSAERLVMGPGADAGLRAGAGVPLHGPNGIVASLTVASDVNPRAFRDLFHERRIELQLTAYAAHERIIELGMVTLPARPVNLSTRQRDVLLWTIRGKTNWEIGEILDISEDTVRQHIGKIVRILDVKNRTQLAAVAVARDLMSAQKLIERG